MKTDKISDLKKSLEAILKIDPEATFEFENCGSGTNVVNVYIAEEAAKKVTEEDVNRLEDDHGVYPADEEGETVMELLSLRGDRGFKGYGFFLLLS